jgi:hypothetical protein
LENVSEHVYDDSDLMEDEMIAALSVILDEPEGSRRAHQAPRTKYAQRERRER